MKSDNEGLNVALIYEKGKLRGSIIFAPRRYKIHIRTSFYVSEKRSTWMEIFATVTVTV